jgi:hypothetical protein
MFTGKPAHLQAFDYLGRYQYFLTFCTHCRRKCFVTPDDVDSVSTQIWRAADEERIAILAYCYMPDHVLVEGEADGSDCLRFIKCKAAFGIPLPGEIRTAAVATVWLRAHASQRGIRYQRGALHPGESDTGGPGCPHRRLSLRWIQPVHAGANPRLGPTGARVVPKSPQVG